MRTGWGPAAVCWWGWQRRPGPDEPPKAQSGPLTFPPGAGAALSPILAAAPRFPALHGAHRRQGRAGRGSRTEGAAVADAACPHTAPRSGPKQRRCVLLQRSLGSCSLQTWATAVTGIRENLTAAAFPWPTIHAWIKLHRSSSCQQTIKTRFGFWHRR